MKKTTDHPSPSQWFPFALNIGLMTLVIFYVAQIGLDSLVWKTMCGNLGGDYCAYWGAAKLANEVGYAEVLDLEKLGTIQQSIYPASLPFSVRPIPYLPIFIVPFQALSFFNPALGYWLWFIINVMVSLLYLRYFVRQTTDQPLEKRALVMILLSLPMFTNLYFGQINIWLMICVGEHLRAALSGKSLQAGAWLGILWLKPQYLALIGLAWLWQRQIRMLAGFSISSLFILAASLLMLGVTGFQKLVGLWIGYTGKLSAVDPFLMMNWRMVAENLSLYIGSASGWILAAIGMMVTLILTVRLWTRPVATSSPSYVITFLGTMIATTAVTWHSHIFSAIILFAPLAYLIQQRDGLPRSLFTAWALVPPATQFLAILLAIIFRESHLANKPGPFLNLLYSAGQLVVNFALLYWAAKKSGEHSFYSRNFITSNET